jgi:hypothetical protein
MMGGKEYTDEINRRTTKLRLNRIGEIPGSGFRIARLCQGVGKPEGRVLGGSWGR